MHHRLEAKYIEDTEVPIYSCPTEADVGSYRVIVYQTVAIPPNSEVVISATVSGVDKGLRWGAVEGHHSNPTGVMVGRTLIDLEAPCVPVRIANLNRHTQTLQEGTCVGKCDRVDFVIDVPPQEEKDVGEAGDVERELAPDLKSLFERSSVGLSGGQQEGTREFLLRRQDLFSKGSMDLGRKNILTHKIETGDAQPSRQRPYRLPPAKREEAVRAIDEMKSQ
ncbi:uncharacterized protein LOC115923222 [Strongylocentrotus purpuratus]|uniref:Uncharacterized protein n=1 Tax=Strongylocentrotus purpuratus TaxID=7668 RepID=A0A7M7NP88_STRPU|nr:uncharacterized protein LOC115923222 [Strongylocentrotus purpuratus]